MPVIATSSPLDDLHVVSQAATTTVRCQRCSVAIGTLAEMGPGDHICPTCKETTK